MARIKYAEGVEPIVNEHSGFTFQKTRQANVMLSSQKNERNRYRRQNNKKLNLMAAVGHWRNLPTGDKENWQAFAAAFPQPSKRNPELFLTGYQLFIKRQHYLFLNEGITEPFMTAPMSEELPVVPVVFVIDQTENCIDVTAPYIDNFGLLPSPGQWLLFKCIPIALQSGQFYEPILMNLQVQNIYIDGMFVSLSIPETAKGVVWSIFLSKPYSRSVTYSGTKTRYMGCFTTKTFLGLTDTPNSYDGEGGLYVAVREDETGLEFVNPPVSQGKAFGGYADSPSSNQATIIVDVNFSVNSPNFVRNLYVSINDFTNSKRASFIGNFYGSPAGAFLDIHQIFSDLTISVDFSLLTQIFAYGDNPIRITFGESISYLIYFYTFDPQIVLQ